MKAKTNPSMIIPETVHDRQVIEDLTDIRIAQTSLLDFILYTMPEYQVNWHHEMICEDIDDFLINPDRHNLMVFVGPRRGKTEIVSRRLSAYYLGKNPTKRIIATSYGADLSQKIAREVKRIISDEPYRKVFPDTRINDSNVRTNSKGSYINTADLFEVIEHRGYYKAAGVGQGITGMGFDLGLIDDPVKNDADAKSPTKQRATLDWYDTTFSTRAAPGAKKILIMTRWNEADLAGQLLQRAMDDPKAEQWDVLCFPEEFDDTHPWIHPDDPRENGEYLWPDFHLPETVDRIKAGRAKVWASLYQQLPSPDGGTIFEREWMRYFRELPQINYYVVSVDAAFKDTSKSDFVAIGVWGVCGANKYLLYKKKERLNIIKTIEEIIRCHNMFKNIKYTLIEDKANGPAIIQMLKNKISRIVPYNPKESKEARAHAVAPEFEAGNVWLPDPNYAPNRTAYPWCVKGVDVYVNDMVGFPHMANDDLVDMTTQFLIKESKNGGWVDQFVQDASKSIDNNAKSDRMKSKLSNLMGWEMDD